MTSNRWAQAVPLVAALGAAVCWAAYIVFGQRLGHLQAGHSVALGLSVAAMSVAFGAKASMEPALAALMDLPLLSEHLIGLQWLAIGLVMCAAAGSVATTQPTARRGAAEGIVQ